MYIDTPAPVYDQNDNVLEETAPNNAKTTYVYDAADQVIQTTLPKDNPTDPDRKVTYEYDLVGNLKKQTEPKGNLTPTDPNVFVTSYTYDEIYQLTAVTNSQGHKISYEYDTTSRTAS